jgi:quercetin dioxygenase-like cupin family protein
MKNLTHLLIAVVATTLAMVFAAKPVMAQDAAKVAGDACKVLLENDQVRVLDFWAKPGQIVAMHSHPAAITYFITAGKKKTILPDGKTSEQEVKAGEARWSDPVTHAIENIGTTEAHVIVVELKITPKIEPKK